MQCILATEVLPTHREISRVRIKGNISDDASSVTRKSKNVINNNLSAIDNLPIHFKAVADPESNSYDIARTPLLGDTSLKYGFTSVGGSYTFIKGNELTDVGSISLPFQHKGEIFESFKVTVFTEKLREEAVATAAAADNDES